MPNLPIRDLGSVGVITDVDPFNLPINAFTRAKNVRFDQGNIRRSPGFRDVHGPINHPPVFIKGIYNANGYDTVVVVTDGFDVYEFANGAFSLNYNSSQSSSAAQVTATSLANVQYLNREDTRPLYRTPAMNNYAQLVNWPSTYTCESLRSYGDFLIAMNMDEGGASFPTRVRFSDIALANNAPSSWDETDTTKSAGFNDLAQMTTPIIDGATLGSNFLIYSSDQVWLMEFVGGTFIFNFRKLFSDVGVINQNCIAEVQGRHYVFDQDDIYMTDGVSTQSICDGRVKDYIFSGIDTGALDRCFVQYDPAREEIYFCYKSSDDMAEFTNGDGCNRAAVFNYASNTWSFLDLPNIYSASTANVDTVESYSTTSATYDTAGSTYATQDAGFNRNVLMLSQASSSDGLSTSRILGLDGIDEGSTLGGALYTDGIKPIKLERVGIDLDSEAQLPLTGYKNIRKMVPQFNTVSSNKTFNVSMGAANLPTQAPSYETSVSLDMAADYKVDSRSSGRYLSYKIETPDNKDFTISGFDFDIIATGRR
jgi:hypothetical protein